MADSFLPLFELVPERVVCEDRPSNLCGGGHALEEACEAAPAEAELAPGEAAERASSSSCCSYLLSNPQTPRHDGRRVLPTALSMSCCWMCRKSSCLKLTSWSARALPLAVRHF